MPPEAEAKDVNKRREHAQKAAVAAEITESIVKNTGTPAEYIYVIFEDVAPSDWAGAGKLFGETPATP
ncbi:tautomerase family protein [Pseudomonas syringae]|uniref:tautomerase family protein n=1 Tax=Pseudomonas syringae TaxID=317 RepID=UPI001F8C292F|nr:tautomerase family protein [Pseudomonas syringae]MCF5428091.1 tautomerase [Pseudomonas syringae]